MSEQVTVPAWLVRLAGPLKKRLDKLKPWQWVVAVYCLTIVGYALFSGVLHLVYLL